MTQESAARMLIGDSLGFHIIFAMLSIGLPLLMVVFETIAIKTGNERLLSHVKGWSKIMIILAVAGVISGTLIAFQFNLIWPQFMKIASPVVGSAFMFEGYFFMIEAIFLAFYVSSWDKIKGYKHVLIGLPIAIGAIGSAVVITLINGWMSEPLGFVMEGDKPTNINTLQALFTTTALFKVAHSVLAYIAATSLLMGGIYATLSLRKRISETVKIFYKKIVLWMMLITTVFVVATMLFGHASAVYLARVEPVKLAAFEIHYNSESHAPMVVGGSLDSKTHEVEDGLVIPDLLSLLVGFSSETYVAGLDSQPDSLWPPLLVHAIFDIKMAASIIMLAVPVTFMIIMIYRRKARWFKKLEKTSLWIVAMSSLLGIVVVELGWMMAEIGRQPYAIKGILFTVDAVTKDNDAILLGYLFPITFLLLLSATILAIWVTIKRLGQKDFLI